MNTNINWYLYTHEEIQKTIAPARETRGASGAKTIATVAMKSCTRSHVKCCFQRVNDERTMFELVCGGMMSASNDDMGKSTY